MQLKVNVFKKNARDEETPSDFVDINVERLGELA
jgi:hypothetical protein